MSPYGRARNPAVRATLDYPRRLNRDATRPMKASGLKDVRAYGKAGSLAARATLDYLRGFYLARLRLVKTRRQKDVSPLALLVGEE